MTGHWKKLFENSKVINTVGGGTDIHPLHQLSEIYHLLDMFIRYGPLPFNLCVNQALKLLVGGSTSGGSNMQQMEQNVSQNPFKEYVEAQW